MRDRWGEACRQPQKDEVTNDRHVTDADRQGCSGRRTYPPKEDESAQLLHKLADLLTNKQDRLPRMEPEVFSGDLLQFPIWLNSFEALIEGKTDVATEKLFFLGKYTAGDARSCIQGYLTLHSEEAYVQARSMLIHRYGDKVKVGRAYKKRLEEWPVVKAHESEKLQKLADFLWQCQAAMATVSYLSSLDSEEENQKIVKKLPYHAAHRWSRVIDRCLYAGGRNPYEYATLPEGQYPSFTEFCQFVSDEARVACGPATRESSRNQGVRIGQASRGRQGPLLPRLVPNLPNLPVDHRTSTN